MKPKFITALTVAFLAPVIGNAGVSSDLPKPGEARLVHFEGAVPKLKDQSVELQYDFDLAKETFEVFVPKITRARPPLVCSFSSTPKTR
jgi:hypothetical protein